MVFDEIDLSILRSFQENGRASLTTIAKRLGMALATVHRRVLRLRAAGVIKGFFARIDPQLLGYGVTAFVRLRAGDRHDLESRLAGLESFPEVEEVHLITGAYDVLIKLRAKDPAHLRQVLADIHLATGTRRATTEVCLASPLERCAPLSTAGWGGRQSASATDKPTDLPTG